MNLSSKEKVNWVTYLSISRWCQALWSIIAVIDICEVVRIFFSSDYSRFVLIIMGRIINVLLKEKVELNGEGEDITPWKVFPHFSHWIFREMKFYFREVKASYLRHNSDTRFWAVLNYNLLKLNEENGRGEPIWTADLSHPKRVRYPGCATPRFIWYQLKCFWPKDSKYWMNHYGYSQQKSKTDKPPLTEIIEGLYFCPRSS